MSRETPLQPGEVRDVGYLLRGGRVVLEDVADAAPFPPGTGFLVRRSHLPLVRPLSWPWDRNPWSEWRWATIRRPEKVRRFLAIRVDRKDGTYFGVYVGAKVFGTGDYPDKGHTWMRPEDAGRRFATWSVTWRWSHRDASSTG